MADEKGGEPPMAQEVPTTSPAMGHNPEALEDAPRAPEARFQNVDLEAGAAATAPPPTNAPMTTKPADGSRLTQLANKFDWGTANLLLAFSSVVVMIASSIICGGGTYYLPVGGGCTGTNGYQVACGTISAFIALVSFFAFRAGMITENRVMEGISLFQWLWWVAGMIVLTFFGSYKYVDFANGYFGTWAAFLFATIALIIVSTVFQRTVDGAANSTRSPLIFLLVASAVVMGASIGPCSPSSECNNYNAFAVALGTISLIFCIILILAASMVPNMVMRAFGVFFTVWWSVGFAVVTFGGPFIMPGNGYFASLGAVFASIGLLQYAIAEA